MHSIFCLALLLHSVLAFPSVEIRDSFITLPIAARINTTGILNVLEADRARALRLSQMAQVKDGTLSADAVVNVPITNNLVDYTASVGIGTPPTQYNLIVDTGSSNTWVGSGRLFVQTSSAEYTGQSVTVDYGGGGTMTGLEYTDTVTLASSLVIAEQSIGVALASTGFDDVDGVLGLGPTALTVDTLDPETTATVPTVVDNLFAQGTIPANLIGISFEPTTSASSVINGQITFGGTDVSKYTGAITYTPITSTKPADIYWGINQSIKYGNTNVLSTTAGIVDTGTTLIMLAPSAYQTYLQQTGGVEDATTGFIRLTPAQFANLQNLNFDIGGTTFSLTPNAQAWPRSLNSLIGGNSQSVYLIVANIGSSSKFDFINGQTFLQRFYSVYDSTNKRVGFATTPFTDATTN